MITTFGAIGVTKKNTKKAEKPVTIALDWDKESPLPGDTHNTTTLPNQAVNNAIDKKINNNAKFIFDLLQSRGIVQPALAFAVAQCYFETAGWTNGGFKYGNNASGIDFNHQEGATKSNRADGTADFKTWDYWAKAMVHELTKGANPSGAQTVEDYVARLRANKYFTSNPVAYTAGIKRSLKNLNYRASQVETNEGEGTPPNTDTTPNKKIPWIAIGAVALCAVGALAIVRR